MEPEGPAAVDVVVRVARADDAAAIADLLRGTPGVWQASWRADVVTRAVRAAEGLAFVAVDGGRVIGFACGHDLGFRAYLSELVVAEAHQRRGVGAALLWVLESTLQARGCAVLVADVHPPAEAFYRSLGWSPPQAMLLRRRLPDDDGS